MICNSHRLKRMSKVTTTTNQYNQNASTQMTDLEDPSEKSRKNPRKKWLQICAIYSAALSAFSGSILFNWTSPAIPILVSDEYPNIDLEDASYLSVIPPIATILISPFFAYFLNRFGRKYTLLSVAFFHFISYILIAFAKSIWIFYLSRVLFGISDVFMFGSLPVYIAEISTPKVRGTWGNAMMLFIFVGQFLVNVVGYYFSMPTTAYIFCSVPLIFFVLFSFMPETPYYLIMKDKEKEAKNSLIRLRGTEDVEEELEQITADVRRQLTDSAAFFDIFTIASNRKAILIALMALVLQQFSGSTAFSVYNQYIFKQAGQDINEGYSSMIFTAMLAIATMCAPMVMEKLGRNMSMVISCAASAVILLAEAMYFYLQRRKIIDLSPINWFPVVGLVLYVVAFSIGMGLVPNLLLGELFATNMRGHASCVMNIAFSLFMSIATKLFQYLMSNFGLYVPFAIFSLCCFIGIGLSYCFIPETKDKTLEEIQQLLKRKR